MFFSSIRNAEIKDLEWRFDGRRCSANILIMAESNSISHRSHKSWSTVLGTRSMAPNSGVYEWVVEIEVCEKGHVFLGIATEQANLDSYVGCDRHGWGLIGTKALWHNKQKVLSNYGSGFQGKSLVSVRYDSDQHTLSYFNAAREWGVAFSDLPTNKNMYPAVSVFQQDDVVNIRQDLRSGNREKPSPSLLRRPWLVYSQALSLILSPCCSAPDIYCGVAKRRRRSGRSTGADYSPSVHRAACALDSGEPRLKEDESAAERVRDRLEVQLLPSSQ